MVFQNYALYPNKTVEKNLAFPLQMRKTPKAEIEKRVLETAKVLDIEHLLQRRPRELSGGQQQRVALGRALVRNPRVFLMDEPLSNLDAKLRVQMRSELKRFHTDLKATIIYVTHDQMEAVTMADKMAVMSGGVLQQYDSPANVFEHPVNTFVAGFVGSPSMNLIRVSVQATPAGADLVSPDGWRYPLSPANAAKALKSPTGDVVLGVRHSAIEVHLQETPNTIPGRVYTVEPTGDLTYAHVYLGKELVVVSVPAEVPLAPDDKVWLGFDQERTHMFEGGSGHVITNA
jgi:multiple sugar transport system ATP-binding protein